MTIRRAARPGQVKFAGVLADGQVEAILSSEEVDRAGDVIVQRGIDYTAFMRAGGPVLWQHDADYPVARTLLMGIVNGNLTATAQFPPLGTSAQSDECYRLIKAGVVTGTSIGFLPRKYEYLDGRQPGSGVRFREIELVEFSFVSVPANRDALIIGKSWLAEPPELDAPAVRQPWAGCAIDRLRAEERQRQRQRLLCQIKVLQLRGYPDTHAGRQAYAGRLTELSRLAAAWR